MPTPFGSVARFFLAAAALICCLALARADTGPEGKTETKLALVIGNSDYAIKSWALDTAARDATDIAAALTKIGFKVMLKTDVGKEDFGKALDEFSREAEHANLALFYFAGHGIQYKGQNYFLPVDAKPRNNRDMSYQSIKMRDVVEAASYAPKTKIIILDACRNSVADPGKAKSRSATGFGDGDGLAQIDSSPDMIIFYSAQHGTTALDKGSNGVNSPFAQSLLKRIPEQGRKITDVFEEVAKDVKADTKEQQIPETVASLTDSVYLNPAETARERWKIIRNSNDPLDFKNFIKQFPDDELVDAAQDRLDKFDAEKRLSDERKAREEDAAKADALEKEKEKIEHALDAERAAVADRVAEQKRLELELRDKEAKEKAEADRQARLEAERKARDEAKVEEKRRADAAVAEDARIAKEKADKEKAEKDAEAKRLADEAAVKKKAADEADAAHREAARLEAEAKAREAEAKAREAAEAAEAANNLEARRLQAMVEQAARKKAEDAAAAKAIADACAQDKVQIAKLEEAGDDAAMQKLGAQSACPTSRAAVADAIKRVTVRQADLCAADQRALAAVDPKNLDAVKAAAANLKCDNVVQAASAQIANWRKRRCDSRSSASTSAPDWSRSMSTPRRAATI